MNDSCCIKRLNLCFHSFDDGDGDDSHDSHDGDDDEFAHLMPPLW